jgi:hypothetical protein
VQQQQQQQQQQLVQHLQQQLLWQRQAQVRVRKMSRTIKALMKAP